MFFNFSQSLYSYLKLSFQCVHIFFVSFTWHTSKALARLSLCFHAWEGTWSIIATWDFIRRTEQWNRWDFHQLEQQCFNLKAFAVVTDTGKCPRHASNCCCSEPWVQFLLPSMRPGRFTSLSLVLCDPPDSIRSLILRIHVIKFGLKYFNVWALSSSCTYHCLLNQGR